MVIQPRRPDASGFAAPQAGAAIVITPGADTVSTPRLQVDFGDAGADVERLDSVRWTTSAAVLTPNLATGDGVGGCDGLAAPRFWGEAGSAAGQPQPVGSGSAGTWTARGGRTVQIDSSRPLLCTGDSAVTPVRTRPGQTRQARARDRGAHEHRRGDRSPHDAVAHRDPARPEAVIKAPRAVVPRSGAREANNEY